MTAPNRGTEAVWPIEGGFAVLCDCATVTHVIVSFASADGAPVEHAAVAAQELAITCDGCGSAHWLTITPSIPNPDEPVVTS